MSTAVKTEREGLSADEIAKQDRRIARLIGQGMNMTRIREATGLGEVRIRKVAESLGLTIARGSGRAWDHA